MPIRVSSSGDWLRTSQTCADYHGDLRTILRGSQFTRITGSRYRFSFFLQRAHRMILYSLSKCIRDIRQFGQLPQAGMLMYGPDNVFFRP